MLHLRISIRTWTKHTLRASPCPVSHTSVALCLDSGCRSLDNVNAFSATINWLIWCTAVNSSAHSSKYVHAYVYTAAYAYIYWTHDRHCLLRGGRIHYRQQRLASASPLLAPYHAMHAAGVFAHTQSQHAPTYTSLLVKEYNRLLECTNKAPNCYTRTPFSNTYVDKIQTLVIID